VTAADRSETALILAPVGRDAAIAAGMLHESHIRCIICPDLDTLIRELDSEIGFVLVTEESLLNRDLRGVAAWIEGQPEWSDLPFVLLTRKGGGLERNPEATRLLDTLGNVTFLERPFHPTTLVSLARAAASSTPAPGSRRSRTAKSAFAPPTKRSRRGSPNGPANMSSRSPSCTRRKSSRRSAS
jgi:hypothetical protein